MDFVRVKYFGGMAKEGMGDFGVVVDFGAGRFEGMEKFPEGIEIHFEVEYFGVEGRVGCLEVEYLEVKVTMLFVYLQLLLLTLGLPEELVSTGDLQEELLLTVDLQEVVAVV